MHRRILNGILLAVWLLAAGCSTLAPQGRIRQPIHTEYSIRDPQFARSLSHLLSAPLVDGNNVVELLNGDQIFPAMLRAIRQAEKSINIEMYIWTSGNVTASFVDALTERARAGVQVHIIVDATGSLGLGSSEENALKRAGVELVRYNPPHPLRPFGINHRTHRKLMVVDGRIGFSGGAGLADEWAGDAEPGQWRDTHFRIEGPVVAEMQSVFAQSWLQVHSEVLHGDAYFPELPPAGAMAAQYFESGPRGGIENARLTYLFSIAAARHDIRLAHAYFLPGKLATAALLDARRRGVRVQVIVPQKSDHPIVGRAARASWGKLLRAGVEFYQYEPTLYHCKLMIVDDAWVTAGSVNFDERSFGINNEANLNVLDPDLARRLIASFDADKAKSHPLTLREFEHRNWFSKVLDRFAGLFSSEF